MYDIFVQGTKRPREDEESDDEPPDEVRLWEDGFKDRYYESKFDCPGDNLEFRYKVAREYAFGLCWVLRYYYQGVPSWKWYFPYHYAPFASDFFELEKVDTEFELNTQPVSCLLMEIKLLWYISMFHFRMFSSNRWSS